LLKVFQILTVFQFLKGLCCCAGQLSKQTFKDSNCVRHWSAAIA